MNETTIRFPDSAVDTAITAISEDPEITDVDLGRLVADDVSVQEVVGDALRDVALQAMH